MPMYKGQKIFIEDESFYDEQAPLPLESSKTTRASHQNINILKIDDFFKPSDYLKTLKLSSKQNSSKANTDEILDEESIAPNTTKNFDQYLDDDQWSKQEHNLDKILQQKIHQLPMRRTNFGTYALPTKNNKLGK